MANIKYPHDSEKQAMYEALQRISMQGHFFTWGTHGEVVANARITHNALVISRMIASSTLELVDSGILIESNKINRESE